MNDTLMDYLDEFVIAYLNDIIVYSNSKKEHIKHVRKILQRLREAEIQADVDKCEFHTTETKFLGMIVGRDGIKMDPEKVRAIIEWGTPNHLKEVQAFLGFVNFYRRFIKDFSKVAKPLIKLTRKDQPFVWSEECQIAFEQLKKRVTEAPVLSYFSPELETFLESDSSDYVSAGVLSQKGGDGLIRPVAYFSKTLSPAECNYEIYDKELLAIIRCFEQWRAELQSVESPTSVLTDHKSLEYFMTTKKLNRRQARWAEFLAEFDFKIAYQPGKKNDKADSLTRRPGDRPVDESDDRNKHMHQTVLPVEKVDPHILQELNDTEEDSELSLFDRVKVANQEDRKSTAIRDAIRDRKKSFDGMLLKRFEVIENTLFFKKKLWVPTDQLKLEIIREVHDKPASGHPGIRRTCKYLSKWYYWPQMKESVDRYIRNCHICRRSKATREKYSGLLNPLPIPDRPWTDVTMDFVTGLPKTKDGFNAILMVVDRLTKMHHYVPCIAEEEGTTAEETARLLINHVWKLHGLPSTIISDRGPQFVSLVWKTVCKTLKINVKLSTAFHPETDGQSEIANQEMERYLRSYCNYQQDDWSDWLSMAEFASNAAVSASTGLSAFMINYGYEPRMSFDPSDDEVVDRLSARERVMTEKAATITKKMEDIWKFTKEKLANAQDMQKRYADRKRIPSPEYKPGDMVWLSTKNIKTERPSRKLDHKWIGPYKVRKVVKGACHLELPQSMKIHDTFHTSLLRMAATDPLTGQTQPPPPPITIDEEEEYEVDDILDSRYHYGKLQYRVAWTGHPPDRAWYPAENFQDHSKEILDDYHRRYPAKPGPEMRLVATIEAMLPQWIRDGHREAKQLVQDVLNQMEAEMKENDRMRSKESSLTNTFDRH
jgi:hypothetical protein